MGANPPDPEEGNQDVSGDVTQMAPSSDTAATLIPPDGAPTTTSGLTSGAVLADTYEVKRLLGEGAFGAVWEATHRRLAGRRVAVKVLHEAVKSEEVLARFRHEAEAAARIVHPNVVTVLDYNTLPSGQPYIVLEHLQGEPLGDTLAPGRLPVDEALRIAEQIGRALHAAHAQGVVHRDLKPDNIFLCDGDGPAVVKVVDFGISKISDSQTVKTQEAVVIGTPCYMSPEQARGDSRNVDARSDVFALGAIVYEMLTGHRAFDSEQVVSTLYRIIHEEPPPIAELNAEVPQQVIAAVGRAMAKKPEDRFPDMAAFIAALTGATLESDESTNGEWDGATMAAPVSQLSTDLSGTPTATSEPPAASHSWWLLGVFALLLLALFWGFYSVRSDDVVRGDGLEPPAHSASANTDPVADTPEPSPVAKTAEAEPALEGTADAPEPSAAGVPASEPVSEPVSEPAAAKVADGQEEARAEADPPTRRAAKRPARASERIKRPLSPEMQKAEAAFVAGDYPEAVRHAKRSLYDGKTSRAYELIAKSHCKLRNLPDAQGALRRLDGRTKRRVRDFCSKAGMEL